MHDYDPSWDYPVIELNAVEGLDDSEKKSIESAIERARKDLAPALNFNPENEFEVFFTEHLGLGNPGSEAVAVYCNGTHTRPVIGFDLQLMKEVCAEVGNINLLQQFEVSLAHELAHAYQESLGLDHEHEDGFDEDDAEEFGRNWADWREINLWLIDPNAQRPVPGPRFGI